MSEQTGVDGRLDHNKRKTGHTLAGLHRPHSAVMATGWVLCLWRKAERWQKSSSLLSQGPQPSMP
jgi:hypothetical protein